MPAQRFTIRRTWSDDDRREDFVFRYGGVDVGRCCLRNLAGQEQQWSWTIYIGRHVTRTVEGVPIAGVADSIDQAKAQFRENFERLIATGAVRLPIKQGPV